MTLREPDTLDEIEGVWTAPDEVEDAAAYRFWKLRDLIHDEIMHQRTPLKGSNRSAEQRERDALNELLWAYGWRVMKIHGWCGRRD